jgi:hypothetical protein
MTYLRRFVPTTASLSLGIALAILAVFVYSGEKTSIAAPLASTWYVDGDTGNDSDDCQSALTACETVGAAIGKASPGDTIHIAGGVYTENLSVDNLNLIGAGMEDTILDGDHNGRVLTTYQAVTITNLTVRYGAADGAAFFDQAGGGIFNNGTLTLESTRVYSNTADGIGGGIFNNGVLILHDSQVLSNTALGPGGGVYGYWPSTGITSTNSLIAFNQAQQGGGVNSDRDVVLIDTVIRDNHATSSAGGLMVNKSISDNNSRLEGVTISGNLSDGTGGGVYNTGATLTMTNSTVSGNIAQNYAGIMNNGNLGIGLISRITILNSTVADNQNTTLNASNSGGIGNINDGFLTIQNSIVAGNDDRQCTAGGTWTTNGYNLSSGDNCDFTQTGDQENTNPKLASLGDYGGPTPTHALLPSSPAIDAGDNSACPASDQRGVGRPFDGDNDASAVCDIGAYEARLQITIDDVSLAEGNAGSSPAIFNVNLSPTSTLPITVDFTTQDGTALSASDYTAASDSLVFAPGQAQATINVSVLGDSDDEPSETFYVLLDNVQGADIVDALAVGEIVDDDGLPSLTIDDVQVNEGDFGSVDAVFEVSLSPTHTEAVMVTYTVTDGTALAGSDYTATGGMLVFDPGDDSQPVTVTVLADEIDEGVSENFLVELSNAINANIGDSQGVGTILDDEVATLSILFGPQISETNSLTTATFGVSLSTAAGFTVTVDYESSDGVGADGALAGTDYLPVTGTLTFAPGEVMKWIDVTILGDIFREEDDRFSIEIFNPSPISMSASVSTGVILNDDAYYVVLLPIVIR